MSKHILIVEDDCDHAESLVDVLEMHGHRVQLAGSGEAAVECFAEHDFDLVLMDVKLPRMNGVEAFFALRRIRPNVQVLMMTGYSLEQFVAQAVDNGALGVLHKPFGPGELLEAVENAKGRGMVLVADDDAEFAESIAPILTSAGYRVEIAKTGQAAVDRAMAGTVDCLVLDMHMPVLSGLEVYMRLKEADRLVPIILVTGYAGEEDTRRLSSCTQGLLVKPFDPAGLLGAIAQLTTPGGGRTA